MRVRSGTPLWEPFFETYEIDQVLIRHSDALAQALDESGGWVEVASDDEFTIWRRRSS